jgi:UDP-N-acetyl-D-glucosamine dehydrogenase
VDLTPENLSAADCVVLVTDHDAFDYDHIARHAGVIVDTRGIYREGDNIVKA